MLNYYFTKSFITNLNLFSDYSKIIYDSQQKNLQLISNFRDVFMSNNTAYYDNNSLIINYLNNSVYDVKNATNIIFYKYSMIKLNYPSDILNMFDSIFYTDLCQNTYVNITCDDVFENNIFYKGLRYSLDFYTSLIDKIIFLFYPFVNNDLLGIYINNNEYFYLPSFLEEYKLRIIYEYINLQLNNRIYQNILFFRVVILIISIVSICMIFLSISINWKKYANKIKLEEYMSNKIIAEIPIYIIRNNVVIRQHLLEFSNKSI